MRDYPYTRAETGSDIHSIIQNISAKPTRNIARTPMGSKKVNDEKKQGVCEVSFDIKTRDGGRISV